MRHLIANQRLIITIILLHVFINKAYVKQPHYKHTILVVHSYHQGLEWTDNITAGILSNFKDESDVNIIVEYLHAKNYNSVDFKQPLLEIFKQKSEHTQPDIIIASDNAAYDFMIKHAQDFYKNIPILFCGVNNLDHEELKQFPNFMGIEEITDHAGTLESIQKIFPDRKKVLIINDNTITGKALKAEIEKVLPGYSNDLEIEFPEVLSVEDLILKLRTLTDEYVVYMLVFNQDKNGNYFSFNRSMKIVRENCSVPIFGSWDFYLNKGLFGGKILKGWDQGQYVGRLAKDIINGVPVGSIEQHSFIENQYVYDYTELKRFNISVSDLPIKSTIINKPQGTKTILRIAIFTSAVLLVIIIILSARLKIKKKQRKLLESLIKQRTAKLDQANLELSEIITKKDKFISHLAHDLRNSMNCVLNYSLLLNNNKIMRDKEAAVKITRNMQTSANQTYGLLEDLLHWGIKQFNHKQEFEITTFSISELIKTVIKVYSTNISNISVEFSDQDDVILESDLDMCKFIIRNILQNAIKYSKENSTVLIKSFMEKDRILITIKDKGIGMSPEIIQSIYNKKPIRKQGINGQKSMGLGLSSALEYIESLNGKLDIESNIEEEGSIFTINLPIVFAGSPVLQ